MRLNPGRRDDIPEPRARLFLARAVLLWEQLWPALWPAVGILGLFLALALFNLLPLLDGWAHAVILALFALAFAGALAWGLKSFRPPDETAARRRLERDSGLKHRPLHAVLDTLPGARVDPATAALWRLHQERMREQIRRLRVKPPHPNLAARDPRALRAAVGLVLFVAAVGTWGDWGPRLSAALSPAVAGGAGAAASMLDIWVTPPQHTGLAPTFLKPATPAAPATGAPASQAPAPLQIPAGSILMARVSGGSGQPRLTANGADTDFVKVDSGAWQVSQPLGTGDQIVVRQSGRELGRWPMVVVPDTGPTIAFGEPPSPTERAALKLDYQAADDYGLAQVSATIRLNSHERGDDGQNSDGQRAALPDTPGLSREPIVLKLPLAGARPKQAKAVSFHDFTPHPWAGLPVLIRLVATDGAGQTGTSDDVAMILPERIFHHPVARAIIEERKTLTRRGHAAREDVAQALSDLSARPGAYQGDLVAFLSLRVSVARLMMDTADAAIPALQQLLWDTALRIEDGGLSIAERDLREAQRKLADALDRNAPDAELQQLMDELQQALDRVLDAMEENIRQALERGEPVPMVPPQMAQQMMDRGDLQRMIEQMRQMAQTGAKDAARQMLSQLQQMLENMQAGMMAQAQQGDNPAQQMMQELQDLAQQQQDLLDQTFRQSQRGQPDEDTNSFMPNQGLDSQNPGSRMPGRQGPRGNPAGPPQPGQRPADDADTRQGAAQQEALRRQLGELMRRMGEMGGDIPRPLGRAERSMRDAQRALGEGDPQSAVPPQGQALEELQNGMQSFAQQMMEQMQGMQAGMRGLPQMRSGRGRDPLGRPMPSWGGWDNNDVRIPEEAEMQRAREILDELRRRSGESLRPRLELDYIERLLKQF